jgi:hypothetical protein
MFMKKYLQAIEGDKMYTYYYLLYTVQLFRDGHFGNKLPSKQFTDDEVKKLNIYGIFSNLFVAGMETVFEGAKCVRKYNVRAILQNLGKSRG